MEEEDNDTPTVTKNADATETNDGDETSDQVSAEAALETDTDENASPNEVDQLPEQPEDLQPKEEENQQVVVKVELPKQIELDSSSSSEFEILSPWAPKPMQRAPRGWQYRPAREDKAYPVSLTLASGKAIQLKVIPYVLVPSDSEKVIQAREPGYQPERGYQQIHSISARLQSTTSNLKAAADTLNESINNLSSLVDSLPK
ncbi:hypothetical protein [Rubritalea tangerina]|uniref:Uncharacterized protein n=1 Tax=Rubritalea tangerina TaxID=430798 RepID=A0ABW4Z612_9BACT